MRAFGSVSRSFPINFHWAFVLALAAAATVPTGSMARTQSKGVQNIEIITLSSIGGPGLVTGGDALVAVLVPPSVSLDQVEVRLNGRVITDVFRVDPITG